MASLSLALAMPMTLIRNGPLLHAMREWQHKFARYWVAELRVPLFD
jgi:hypothetical protein